MNIIELAKEAGFEVWEADYALQGQLERFAALVRAEVLAEQAQLQQAKEMLFAVDDVVKQSIDDIKTLSCAGFVLPTMTLKTEASQVKTMTPEEYKTFIEPVKQEPVALSFPRDTTSWTGGWTIDYKLVRSVDDAIDDNEFKPCLESVEQVLLALEKVYAAPVSAKREWVDLTPIELAEAFSDKGSADAGIRAVITAFKERNK